MSSAHPETVDVIVVGGGPAGLATAIGAANSGARVVLVDHARPPIDKACGEGLMPDGVQLLERLGVELEPEQRQTFCGIRWIDGPHTVAGRFPAGPGLGIRRKTLHGSLVRRAEQVGVDLRWGWTVRGLERDAVRTDKVRIRARWIVGADGLRSPVRRWAGLAGRPTRRPRFGLRRHWALEPWSDRVEVHWADDREAYVTPVGPRSVGIALLWSGRRPSPADALDLWPALAERLRGAEPISSWRGAGPLEQRARAVVRGNVALVGDAGGYVDAITGEGLSVAFHQASALVGALGADCPSRYAAAHRGIMALPNALTRLLLVVERKPRLRRRVMAALAARPDLFEKLLAVHVRAAPAARVGGPVLARLAWRLLVVPPRHA